MTRQIDYYFTCISPFTYLGHKAINDVAARHEATLVYKPVNLGGLWEESGAVPLPKRSPMRQRYRLIELQRAAELRGLPINPKPTHFPTNPTLADHTAIAIVEAGGDPTDYLARVFAALWVEEKNVADAAVLGDALAAAGHDADAILAAADTEAVAATRTKNTEDAVAADAVGAPAYVLDGEPFWGQDRIEYLERMLATGRAPFSAPA